MWGDDDYGMLDALGEAEWGEPAAPASNNTAAAASIKHEEAAVSSSYNNPKKEASVEDDAYSGVDGKGLWKSWTHNYEQPRFACLDLLDNCFDATLTEDTQFEGKVTLRHLTPNGIVISNNSSQPIKSLRETLTAYRSQKNAGEAVAGKKDAIGEYGVGLKQACATLSNTSFVLTKNNTEFQLGVIAESLQDVNWVSFPHFPFEIDPSSPTALEEQIQRELTKSLKDYPAVFNLITNTLGHGNRQKGIQTMVQQYAYLYSSDEWKNYAHIFQMIITNFIPTDATESRTHDGHPQHPALAFLEEIRQVLPKHYINVPLRRFSFTIEDKPVQFVYWQHRLVEMTKFEVHIPKDKPVVCLPNDTPWTETGYPLSIYCGFDPLRVDDKEQAKTCQLCIYSRQSGRLIETTPDARHLLGLGKSGVDFSQGLTIILDDVRGELPLKPTKDGLTWTKDQAHGETHKANLLAWAGAIAGMYWKYHAGEFESRSKTFKSDMSEALRTFAQPVRERLEKYANHFDINDPSLERMEDAKFIEFAGVKWNKKQNPNDRKIKIFRKGAGKLHVWRDNTPASVWKLEERHYPEAQVYNSVVTPASRKRGRSRGSVSASSSNKRCSWSSLGGGTPMMTGSLSACHKNNVNTPQLHPESVASNRADNGNDSSSGEEEEIVEKVVKSPGSVARTLPFASPQMVRSLSHGSARKKITPRSQRRSMQLEHMPPLPEMQGSAANHNRAAAESPRVKELEQALQASMEEVEALKADLQQAQQQLMNPPKSRALELAELEKAHLKRENEQLQQTLQSEQQALETEKGKLMYTQDQLAVLQREKQTLQQQLQQLGLQAQQKLQTAQQNLLKLGAKAKEKIQVKKQANAQLQQEKLQLERQLQESENRRAYEAKKTKLEMDQLKLELEQRGNTIDQMSGSNGFVLGQGTDQI